MESAHPLVDAIEPLLADNEVDWDAVLTQLTSHYECPVGTIHLMDESGMLRLAAHCGLPPPVIEKVDPVGELLIGQRILAPTLAARNLSLVTRNS